MASGYIWNLHGPPGPTVDLTSGVPHADEVRLTFTERRARSSTWNATSTRYPQGMGATFQARGLRTRQSPTARNPIMRQPRRVFTDVPGLESIAEGHAEKSLGTCRWRGRAAGSTGATRSNPSAPHRRRQDTLINVLHYMRGKRDSVSVAFVCVTRQILLTYLDLSRATATCAASRSTCRASSNRGPLGELHRPHADGLQGLGSTTTWPSCSAARGRTHQPALQDGVRTRRRRAGASGPRQGTRQPGALARAPAGAAGEDATAHCAVFRATCTRHHAEGR